MADWKTLKVETTDRVATITLNRPEVHNAFNSEMIEELHRALSELEEDRSLRVVLLTGAGKSFCAGADLNWMREIINFGFQQNLDESLRLFDLFERLYNLSHPTLARVNGSAIGGGMGLVAACDIVVAAETAKFSLSEVKVGVVPACISPFVIRRAGEGRCREFFLTGERLSADRALAAGLAHRVVPRDSLDLEVDGIVQNLLTSGPGAIAICKQLLGNVPRMGLEEARDYTARIIAELRTSAEGQEGMCAFLEKRKPSWSTSGREGGG